MVRIELKAMLTERRQLILSQGADCSKSRSLAGSTFQVPHQYFQTVQAILLCVKKKKKHSNISMCPQIQKNKAELVSSSPADLPHVTAQSSLFLPLLGSSGR